MHLIKEDCVSNKHNQEQFMHNVWIFYFLFSKITFYLKLFSDCCDQFGYPGSIVYLSCFFSIENNHFHLYGHICQSSHILQKISFSCCLRLDLVVKGVNTLQMCGHCTYRGKIQIAPPFTSSPFTFQDPHFMWKPTPQVFINIPQWHFIKYVFLKNWL